MKLKITFISMIITAFIYSPMAFAEGFTAKVGRLAIETGTNYDGARYCEVTFTEVTELSEGGTLDYYYAIPLADEPAFSYLFTILKYAKERNKSVRIVSDSNWTRSDGTVFGRITYAE